MDGWSKLFSARFDFTTRNDDDAIDRMHRLWSTGVLIAFAVLMQMTSYVGKPVSCWLNNDAINPQRQYIEDMCWVSNTYWIPFKDQIPGHPGMAITDEDREKRELNYYQWIPLVLVIQSAMFYLPCLIWQALNSRTNLHMSDLVDTAHKLPLNCKETLEPLARNFDLVISDPQSAPSSRFHMLCSCGNQRRSGVFLFISYMFTKLLYVANALGQLFLMNAFLGADNFFFGITALKDVIYYRHVWKDTGIFPRVTMCDFLVRVLGNLHRHSVQCVLPINMFNEKIYIFLWLWTFLVLIITVCNFLLWVVRMTCYQRDYIRMFLRAQGLYDSRRDEKLFDSFMSYLRTDGVFMIRLIKINAGDLAACKLVGRLWSKHRRRIEAVGQFKGLLQPDRTASDSKDPNDFKKARAAARKRDNSLPDDDFV